MSKIYAIGEALYDILFKNGEPITAKAGGSVLNTCISLGKLGCNPSLISEIGNDDIGNLLLKFLTENGVNADFVSASDINTPIALAFLNENNEASYSFYKDKKTSTPAKPIAIEEQSFILFGSSYALNPLNEHKINTLLSNASKKQSIILYDPNFRKSIFQKNKNAIEKVAQNISKASIVRASDEDMQNIFAANDYLSSYKNIKNIGCNILVYTSSQEVWVCTDTMTKKYDVPKISPISTIGAGDNFNAGIIFSLKKNGITLSTLNKLTDYAWDNCINTAIDFATDVCCSYDNYISEHIQAKHITS